MRENVKQDKSKYFQTDAGFNELYPFSMQMLAERHWTPLHVARVSAAFLAENGGRILDVGSGVGKFCLAGAYYNPDAQFTGVEQRAYLINHAVHAQRKLELENISFIQGNLTQLDLKVFDHFYFYNAFFENIDDLGRIDERIDYSEGLYDYYVSYLHNSLKEMPAGTRIVTYHSFREEIPAEYRLIKTLENGDLNFWIK